MKGPTVAAALAALLIAGVPLAAAKEKIPVEEGPDNGVGTVWIEPYPEYTGKPVNVEATVTLKEFGGVDEMRHVMIAFNTHTTTLAIDFVAVNGPGGQPLTIGQDQRDADPRQPKVFIETSELPPIGEPIRLTAQVVAGNNGAYHIGVLAAAFDRDWEQVVTDRGFRAEVYGFTMVGSHGQEQAPFEPPFEGRGNLVPGAGAVLAGLAVVGAAAASRRIRD